MCMLDPILAAGSMVPVMANHVIMVSATTTTDVISSIKVLKDRVRANVQT